MKKIAILLLMVPMTLFARFSAKDALISAPDAIVGYVGTTDRLDMVDYLEAGLTDRTVRNRRGGESRLIELSDSNFTVRNGSVQTLSARLLAGKSDTLIAVIETLATPGRDSKLTIYNKEWQPVKKAWAEPSAKDWGKPAAKFLLTEYELRGDTLILTDRTSEWQTEGAPAISHLKYIWNRKSEKFTRLK